MGGFDRQIEKDWDKATGGAKEYQSRLKPRGAPKAEYIYKDEDGEPHMRVQRFEWEEEFQNADRQTDIRPVKTFRQSHYEKNGYHNRWAKGAPSRKIPYRLPELKAAPRDQRVFITEGEKDADTLAALGFVATTAPNGAGKWPRDFDRYFDGFKTVLICEDNDRSGERHTISVARGLEGAVSEMFVLKFKDMPDKSDVTDWVEAQRAAGKTDAEIRTTLIARADAAPRCRVKRLRMVAGDIAGNVHTIEQALLDAEVPVFQRSGKLVMPLWTEHAIKGGGKTRVSMLQTLTPITLAGVVTKFVGVCEKADGRASKKQFLPCDPPPKSMEFLCSRGYGNFHKIAGVINAPTLRPDGTLLWAKGYDEQTKLWCEPDPDVVVEQVDKPTRENALAALALYNELLAGFPFVSELDKSVALSAILTVVLRGAFDVCPMFLFLAHQAGTGKSYLADLISTIVRGRPCPVIGLTDKEEENEKRLSVLLMEGGALYSLDNLSRNLSGDMLCRMTSQRFVKPRILGKSEMPECECVGVLIATGNNITFAEDMTRRGLTVNLDAGVERPEKRAFAFDPIEKVLADRGAYLQAAITIARAYLASERVALEPLGTYGGWSTFAREPLAWLGLPDPAKAMEQQCEDDPERSRNRELIAAWRLHLNDRHWRVAEIIKHATETKENPVMKAGEAPYVYVRPDLYELLLEHAGDFQGKGIKPKMLGKWLARVKGQVHDGHKIVVVSESSGHGNRWALVKA